MTDWFRNTTWDQSVENAFHKRLQRARKFNRNQYLLIQAWTLAHSHPEVSLDLLDLYFELPESIDQAGAHTCRAEALIALGRIDESIASYEAALSREATHPTYLTGAYIELPFLIATRAIRPQYRRAIELLDANKARGTFPVEQFQWHAARALIAADIGNDADAARDAELALEAAGRKHSGFRYHPTVGLVSDRYASIIRHLEEYLTDQH